MAKVRNWIGAVSAPVLLVSAGCSIVPRPFANVQRGLPPERLMSMAQAFERQGHLLQAQNAYLQVLALEPGFPKAQQSLDTVIAKQNQNSQRGMEAFGNPPRELYAKNRFPVPNLAPMRSQPIPVPTPLPLPEQHLVTTPVINAPVLVPPPPVQAPLPSMKLALSQLAALEAQDQPPRTNPSTILPPETRTPEPLPTAMPALSDVPSIVQVEVHHNSAPQEIPAAPEVTQAIAPPPATPVLPVELPSILVPPIEPAISLAESPAPVSVEAKPVVTPALPMAAPTTLGVIDASHHETGSVKTEPQPVASPAQRSVAADEETLEFFLPRIAGSQNRVTATVPATATESPHRHEWVSKATRPTSPIKEEDGALDSTQFVEPMRTTRAIPAVELKSFFGPFTVQMISKLREHREEFQNELVDLVTDDTAGTEVRSRAVFLLGAIGPDAIDAVPMLHRELHRKSDLYFKISLAESILKIAPEDELAIEVLIECLSVPNTSVRWVATFALRNVSSPHATFVVDRLRKLLTTDDPKLQRMVFLTLAEFGPAAAAAIPELEAALQSPDQATREVARASLDCIAPDRKTAVNLDGHPTDTRLTHWK